MSNQLGLFVKTAFVLSLFIQSQWALADGADKKLTSSAVDKQIVNQEDIKDAVVKIIVVSHVIDKKEPWNSSIDRSSGSGFIIEGDRILTNAHVVSNATFIEVQKQAETKRYEAKTIAISHEADLAIITLKEKSDTFFKTKKLTFGGLPELQKEVSTFGYPTGGSGLSVTKGVVSRIERSSYVHKGKSFISVQIDAAINPGNSGGPVLSNGKVVGVVMQSRTLSQSIGYMIPVPVINHFLEDLEDGNYDGFPSLGIDVEKIESPAIRELYGLKEEQSGVLVTLVYPGTPTTEVLRKNDIITAIDGHSISNNAKTELRHKELINFNHYVDMRQIGDEIKLAIIREGKEQEITVKLSETDDALRLVGARQFERPPSYFVFGGFVFMPLTSDYISASNSRYSSGLDENITVLKQFWPTKERTQAVILTNVLPDDSNKGFHNIGNMLVDKLNGEKFKDFNTFYNMLMKGDSKFVVLEDQFGFQVVINRKLALEKQDKILERYSIASGESKDLKELSKPEESATPTVLKDDEVEADKKESI